MRPRPLFAWLLPVLLLLAAGGWVIARESPRVETIAAAELPPEALATLRLIRQGGPYPHAKDGTVFGNRERILPARPRGYYTEYTVRTPGARDRGARRIVAGGRPKIVEYYYTDDHYASFKRIQPEIGHSP